MAQIDNAVLDKVQTFIRRLKHSGYLSNWHTCLVLTPLIMPENGATLMWLLYRRIFQMIVLMIVFVL